MKNRFKAALLAASLLPVAVGLAACGGKPVDIQPGDDSSYQQNVGGDNSNQSNPPASSNDKIPDLGSNGSGSSKDETSTEKPSQSDDETSKTPSGSTTPEPGNSSADATTPGSADSGTDKTPTETQPSQNAEQQQFDADIASLDADIKAAEEKIAKNNKDETILQDIKQIESKFSKLQSTYPSLMETQCQQNMTYSQAVKKAIDILKAKTSELNYYAGLEDFANTSSPWRIELTQVSSTNTLISNGSSFAEKAYDKKYDITSYACSNNGMMVLASLSKDGEVYNAMQTGGASINIDESKNSTIEYFKEIAQQSFDNSATSTYENNTYSLMDKNGNVTFSYTVEDESLASINLTNNSEPVTITFAELSDVEYENLYNEYEQIALDALQKFENTATV